MSQLDKIKKKWKKRAIRWLIGKIAIIFMKLLPTLLIASIIGFVLERFTSNVLVYAKETPNAINEVLGDDLSQWVEIKGDAEQGYFYGFKDGLDEKLEELAAKLNEQEDVQSVSATMLKKMIKAQVYTQYPDLGGVVESDEPSKCITDFDDLDDVIFIGDTVMQQALKKKPIKYEIINKTVKDSTPKQWNENAKTKEGKKTYSTLPNDGKDVKAICIMLGSYAPDQIDDMKSLLTKLHSKYPKKKIYVQKALAIDGVDVKDYSKVLEKYNEQLEEFCNKTQQNDEESERYAFFIDTSEGVSIGTPTVSSSSTSHSGKYKIGIAAGHNFAESGEKKNIGARSPNGDKEEELVLKVAEYVEEIMKDYSDTFEVIQTGTTRDNKKGVTIGDRNRLAQEANVDLNIQIHLNDGAESNENVDERGKKDKNGWNNNLKGTLTIYKEKGSESEKLATSLAKTISSSLGFENLGTFQPDSDIGNGTHIGKLGIIGKDSELGFPTVVTEGGYLCNKDELKVLSTDEGLKKYAQGIVDGIFDYYGIDKSSTTKSNTETKDTSKTTSSQSTTSSTSKQYIIGIGAGHSKENPGAVSPEGDKEENLTIKVAEKVEELMKPYESQFKVVQIGSTKDKSVPNHAKKGENTRVVLAQQANADCSIQIHFNAGSGSGWNNRLSGTMCYYKEKGEAGKASQTLAKIMSKTISSSLGFQDKGTTSDLDEPQFNKNDNNGLGIIGWDSKLGFPSIVTEGGYLCNQKELKLMKSEEGITKYAQGIVDGIFEYFGGDKNNTTTSGTSTKTGNGAYIKLISNILDYLVEKDSIDEEEFQGQIKIRRISQPGRINNISGGKGSFTKYELSEDQLVQIARLCQQEQGTAKGAAAEASLMANMLETTYKNKYEQSANGLYTMVRTSGWFANAAHFMASGSASEEVIKAVRSVIIDGKRTLPGYVNEHDCFSDIASVTNGNSSVGVSDRTGYVQYKSVVHNRMGSTYIFYSFPDTNSDPFGYINEEDRETIGELYYDFDTGEAMNGTGTEETESISDIIGGIGYLSAKYESGVRGIRNLGESNGETQVKSGTEQTERRKMYVVTNGTIGKYGFSYDSYLPEFIEWCYNERNTSNKGGTTKIYDRFKPYLNMKDKSRSLAEDENFRKVWLELCDQYAQAFEEDQDTFVYKHVYLRAVQQVRSATGIDIDSKHTAVKSALLSIAVREGAMNLKTNGILEGIKNSDSEEEIINKLYANMQKNHEGENRWNKEKSDAIAILKGKIDLTQEVRNKTNTQTEEEKEEEKKTEEQEPEHIVAIAAGHNDTDDKGAEVEGLIERDLTIKVAEYVAQFMTPYPNIKIVQTGSSVLNKSVRLEDRVALQEQANAELGIQIHFNTNKDQEQSSGVKAYYKQGDETSLKFAYKCSLAVAKQTGLMDKGAWNSTAGDETDEIGLSYSNASGITNISIKGGYLDNEGDREIIKTEEGLQAYAKGIVDAILEYYEIQNKGYGQKEVSTDQQVQDVMLSANIRDLKYIEKEEFEEKVASGSSSALNYFTLNEENRLIIANWSYANGKITIKKSSEIGFENAVKKYTTPYQYFLYWLINTGDKYFVNDFLDYALDCEIIVAIQDNINKTQTIVETQYKTGNEGWHTHEKSSTVTETVSNVIELTYADTWFARSEKTENSFSTEDIVNKQLTVGGEIGEEGKKLGEFKIRTYCEKCSPKKAGTTASGVQAKETHTIAVSSKLYQDEKSDLSKGKQVLINGTVYTVEDMFASGGDEDDKTIDIFVETVNGECNCDNHVLNSYDTPVFVAKNVREVSKTEYVNLKRKSGLNVTVMVKGKQTQVETKAEQNLGEIQIETEEGETINREARKLTTTINTTRKFSTGKTFTRGKELEFASLLLNTDQARYWVTPTWLFEKLEQDETTRDFTDLTRYLLYKTYGHNYNVLDYDFSIYYLSTLEMINKNLTDVPLYQPATKKEDFIKAMEEFSVAGAAGLKENFDRYFLARAEEIYELGQKYQINPELIVVFAYEEEGFNDPVGDESNFWKLASQNSSSSATYGSFGSFESGVKQLATQFLKYNEGAGTSQEKNILQYYNERQGCNAKGYGKPGTLKGMLTVYKQLLGSRKFTRNRWK